MCVLQTTRLSHEPSVEVVVTVNAKRTNQKVANKLLQLYSRRDSRYVCYIWTVYLSTNYRDFGPYLRRLHYMRLVFVKTSKNRKIDLLPSAIFNLNFLLSAPDS